MRTLSVDIEGLDLVLGGGFSLLERVPGAGESATILIRGAAGSGKTVLGTQFAASIARALESDVAYGCVELLPSELRAQYESVRPKSRKDEVVFLSEVASDDPAPEHEQVRIYAGLLDIAEDGSSARFGNAVEALMAAANVRAHRSVRVLVIDSLSDGYGLGAGAPRALADGVSKFAAEQGLVVILLEEQASDASSIWSFAVDTVFELKPADETTPFERRLLIPKNRLGPSDPGPHEFMIRSREGVMIMPRVKAYQRQWRREVLQNRAVSVQMNHPWFPDERYQPKWLPDFRAVTTAVVGKDPSAIRQVALWLGRQLPGSPFVGDDIRLVMGQSSSPLETRTPQEKQERAFLSWGPLQSGPLSLFTVMREIGRQARKDRTPRTPRRVIIGDLAASRYHSDPGEIAGAISVLASLLRELKIPLVLYETDGEGAPSSMAAVNADVVCTCLGPSVIPMGLTDLPSGDTLKEGEDRLFRLSTERNSESFAVRL